jgi:hypothetical protein
MTVFGTLRPHESPRDLDQLVVSVGARQSRPGHREPAGSFERHGVDAAFRTQIEMGIVEYCGATERSRKFLYETDTRSRAALAAEVADLASAVAARQQALTH